MTPQENPIVVYTTVAVAALVVIALGLSKALPPVIEAVADAKKKLRLARQEAEDARIIDLSSQVDHLAGRVWSLEQREDAQRAVLLAHARWDADLIQAAISAGVEVTNPPPLWPTIEDVHP